eukprot:TRINITY_DN34543_c0_g1_i1.p6 TRINITY_DN34543_c0_g1~~TRINITY_DN34543_c0_g1_i1.p6  ORF type:complete len:103 (+),score=3.87 TRINITY_DN34543_c0_g1_i1:332-640(+)
MVEDTNGYRFLLSRRCVRNRKLTQLRVQTSYSTNVNDVQYQKQTFYKLILMLQQSNHEQSMSPPTKTNQKNNKPSNRKEGEKKGFGIIQNRRQQGGLFKPRN